MVSLSINDQASILLLSAGHVRLILEWYVDQETRYRSLLLLVISRHSEAVGNGDDDRLDEPWLTFAQLIRQCPT
jgi:hypothetical protein